MTRPTPSQRAQGTSQSVTRDVSGISHGISARACPQCGRAGGCGCGWQVAVPYCQIASIAAVVWHWHWCLLQVWLQLRLSSLWATPCSQALNCCVVLSYFVVLALARVVVAVAPVADGGGVGVVVEVVVGVVVAVHLWSFCFLVVVVVGGESGRSRRICSCGCRGCGCGGC